ncbi:MAG: GAF and ANTAR domain-containing protein, partial [Stackebrandtia sp.]
EGPCRDAFAERRPVLVSNLHAATLRWPGYGPAATAAGVAAAFAFPLCVGAAGLGVLDVFADRPGPLRDGQVAVALTFADAATDMLLETAAPDGHLDEGLQTALDYRTEIYQAQGMVMIQLDVSLTEALARMRAHAFATERDLTELSRAIVSGGVRLDRDDG